jgi:hypothetical protein
MLGRLLRSWCTLHRPDMLGCLWMAVLLGSLTGLDFRDGGFFLIPPFTATLAILVYQPNVSIAQPIAVVSFVRQRLLWRCVLLCCIVEHGLRLQTCCHSRLPR